MAMSIGEIKEIYQAACENELPEFVERFNEDTRGGVIKLVESARKRFKAYEEEKARIYALQEYERKYGEFELICGIDEVGRGPLAGPVVAEQLYYLRIVIFYILMILKSSARR